MSNVFICGQFMYAIGADALRVDALWAACDVMVLRLTHCWPLATSLGFEGRKLR
jgi:hypothetical protein